MYYLLEDNRIIDSENYKEPYILSKDVIRNHEVLFLTSFKDQVSVKGTIKKQSENVYDFIDWNNDLVRIAWSDKRSFIIDCTINKSDFDEYYSLEWINAIYKPDAKGNYIKVWEKKDE